MTNEEVVKYLKKLLNLCDFTDELDDRIDCEPYYEAVDLAIKALEQKPNEQIMKLQTYKMFEGEDTVYVERDDVIKALEQEPKTGHCKECKYFEYDSVAKVDGIPLIVAHEICSRWGDGCKTKEDGYCFLFEPQESEGE